jgi:hypothetical protein
MAVLLTTADAMAQIEQAGYRRDCRQCQGSYIGFQSADVNACCDGRMSRRDLRRMDNSCDSCDPGRGISRCWTDCGCFNNSCLGQCCATKAYPDAGWAAPAFLPVNRDGIWYGAYHPQAWYGAPGGGFIGNYPTVYQPTDTTQLGYSYAKVPTWQPRPWMLPPTPQPSQFHTRACPGGGCFGGHHGYYGNGSANCQQCMGSETHLSGQAFTSPDLKYTAVPSRNRRTGMWGGFKFASFGDLID